MNKKTIKYLKIIITVVIAALFLWFLVIKPLYTFKRYEHKMEEAAKRYYELNELELPTGSRISTLTMQQLYHKSYLTEDFYIPFTKEPCDMKASWVKVKKEDGKYKYYTYLKCGALHSRIDNRGPEIKLNGASEITVNLGEEYKEQGVKSVVDNKDGKIDTKSVIINADEVDTSKVGTYEVTYTVSDSLKNKTTVTRKVKVVSKIKNAVNKATDNKGYYVGEDPNNYLSLSGMLFRIIGVDGNNVKIIADKDVANVNYDGINKWLDYYMEHINDQAKRLLVKNKYCNMAFTDENLDEVNCTSTTKEKYVSLVSITDINKSLVNGTSYLKPGTMSWTANVKDDSSAYVTRNLFFGETAGSKYLADKKTENYGIRPVLTVKGDTLIESGDGTLDNPYNFNETKPAKTDDKLNTRYSGEYVEYAGDIWRIVEVNSDGTTKVISNSNINRDGNAVKIRYDTTKESKVYNPTEKGNIGYYINNKVSEFIDTSYFVNKEVTVPIYDENSQYGKEKSTKKYKVKLSAPNTYEMFSAISNDKNSSYWLINSSNKKYYKTIITDIGVVVSGEIGDYVEFGIRVVGNLAQDVAIVKGDGTLANPYRITK